MYSEEPMNYAQCDYSTLPIFGIWSCYCFCLLSYLSSINWQFLCISCIAIPTRDNRPVAKILFSKKKSSLVQMQMFAIPCGLNCTCLVSMEQKCINISNAYRLLIARAKLRTFAFEPMKIFFSKIEFWPQDDNEV
jgi:hypothetical protein